jgi:hypothetical protein
LLFSNTFKYLTSNPLLVNISNENCMLSGGRLQAFAFVIVLKLASAESTNSD